MQFVHDFIRRLCSCGYRGAGGNRIQINFGARHVRQNVHIVRTFHLLNLVQNDSRTLQTKCLTGIGNVSFREKQIPLLRQVVHLAVGVSQGPVEFTLYSSVTVATGSLRNGGSGGLDDSIDEGTI